jgi:autotransporter-associated beta strand protein
MVASQSDITAASDPLAFGFGWDGLLKGMYHAYVSDGGAIIDTQGFVNQIHDPLEHDPLASPVDGGLTKLGAGQLTLLQASNYTGDTSVNAGILELRQLGLDDAADVYIAAGAWLDLAFNGVDTIDELWLGGVQVPAGIHDATTDPGFISNTGQLLVLTGGAAPVVVPEPATLALVALGAIGLVIRRK